METFSALLALCAGNSPITGEFPHKGQWRGALMFTLICVWINYWAKNREAGDLRRHRAHYGVTVMSSSALNTSVGALYTESPCVFYGWVLRPHNLQKNEIFDNETIGPPNSKNHNHNSKNRNHIQIITPFASFAYDHLLIFNIMY